MPVRSDSQGKLPRARSDETHPDGSLPSRRHRPASEVRFPPARDADAPVSALARPSAGLSDDIRLALWALVDDALFAPRPDLDPWTSGVAGRPAVARVWSAPPLSGDPDDVPEDIAEVVEGWFALVDAADILAFVEAVHDNLEPSSQPRFAAACNGAFERHATEYRFVLRRLVPIASRSDIATIERALAACKRAAFDGAETSLLTALDKLGARPRIDSRGAIEEAIRAVEAAAFALTGERYLSLDDALDDLGKRRYIDGAFKAAYSGLFGFAARRTTNDEARLIVVMCASLVAHLAGFAVVR